MNDLSRVAPSYERLDRFLSALRSSGLVETQQLQRALIEFESLPSSTDKDDRKHAGCLVRLPRRIIASSRDETLVARR